MTHAIIVEEAGCPEVMQWQEINLEAPGPGQALVRQTVVGAGRGAKEEGREEGREAGRDGIAS